MCCLCSRINEISVSTTIAYILARLTVTCPSSMKASGARNLRCHLNDSVSCQSRPLSATADEVGDRRVESSNEMDALEPVKMMDESHASPTLPSNAMQSSFV